MGKRGLVRRLRKGGVRRLLALDTPENLKKQTPDGSLETFFITKSGRGWDA